MSIYAESKDFIEVGGYEPGKNPTTDRAVELHPQIEEFLIQEEMENSSLKDTVEKLSNITGIKIPQEEYLTEEDLQEVLSQSAASEENT
jgi:flagellum-specific ATP synthase